jgi:hypothetical protein
MRCNKKLKTKVKTFTQMSEFFNLSSDGKLVKLTSVARQYFLSTKNKNTRQLKFMNLSNVTKKFFFAF